jgi:predicted metalloprotease
VDRCKTFFTENRQLITIPVDNSGNNGNLPLIDSNPDPTNGPSDIVTLLPADLTRYWTAALADESLTLTPPKVTVFSAGDGTASCDGVDESTLNDNITYCRSNNTVFIDQQFADEKLSSELEGDMSIGYLISQGYSEIVQDLMGSKLKGEPRALLDDCLTGSWIHDDLPASSSPTDAGDHE